MTSRKFSTIILAGAFVGIIGFSAAAQDKPIEFRMAATKGNASDCMSLDAPLSRVHTFTITGETAKIKSAGGIDDNMKQTAPKVYTTTFSLNGVKLDVLADTSTVPRTLKVSYTQRGCSWVAVTP